MSTVAGESIVSPRIRSHDYLKRIEFHLRYSLGLKSDRASPDEIFHALVLSIRQDLTDRMLATEERYSRADAKRVYYLSIEYLIGRLLRDTLSNLGVYEICEETVHLLGMSLDEVCAVEPDAALGNGGLGRLAACYLDSMATLGIPGYGYGINYEYGLFRQEFENGQQKERPDHWLANGSPWQLPRSDQTCTIPVYGRIEDSRDRHNRPRPVWQGWKLLLGVPVDIAVAGWGGHTVNSLRLFSARSSREFDMNIFNSGDYIKAVEQKISSESITKVLYPSDSIAAGRELRLLQEYFLVACALQDIIRRFTARNADFADLPNKVAIQLNDTHPALAIPEMMRILTDHQSLPWEQAWDITHRVFGYTNHTLLPEALEKWPAGLLQHVLPRHALIVDEINSRFLKTVSDKYPGDFDRLRRMSLVEEGGEKHYRMANLSIVGSHKVNGVAAIHSELVKKTLVPDFYELWPEKFTNVTNGVTPRRWLHTVNPELSRLLISAIGDGWIRDLDQIRQFDKLAGDSATQREFQRIKLENKRRLVELIREQTRHVVNPESLFDVHIKRMHEYKRQLLNALHIIHLFFRVTDDGVSLPAPRTFIFAGKAAPGYARAKLIIRFINAIADVVNNDARARDQLHVVFLPDYRVTLAEQIIPAADLSEQISTAGMEASGTGNMKLALNGALTIGTLDGANIEIRDAVAPENIYIFGLTAEEVVTARSSGSYNPQEIYQKDPNLRRVLDSIRDNRFSPGEPSLFQPIFDSLLYHGDYYMHFADFASYAATQEKAGEDFTNHAAWTERAIHNVARVGRFSSDRAVSEYAANIWNVAPVTS